MSTILAPPMTADDLLALPDGDDFELVDGQLVERKMGAKSTFVGGEIYRRVASFNDVARLGTPLMDGVGYRCFRDDLEKVRKPDASFIRSGRLPNDELPDGWITICPDLAVEVVSPNDLVYEVDEKVEEWLAAGVKLVWVAQPERRIVRVHRPDGSVKQLRAHEEITGEDVLPGFACRVAEFFPAQVARQP